MKKTEKRLLIMVIIMGLVLGLVYLPGVLKGEKIVKATAAPAAKKDEFAESGRRFLFGLYDDAALAPLERLKSDPFQPPSASTAEAEAEYVLDIELTGVFESRKGKFAVVNNRKVTEGDTFGGMVIDRIEKKGIYVRKWNKEYYVPLHQPTRVVIKRNNK